MKNKKLVYDPESSAASSTDTLLGRTTPADYGSTISTRCPSPTSDPAAVDAYHNLPQESNLEQPSLRSALKSRTLQLIVVNFAFLAFSEMCYSVLMPLMYSTSIELGGLGLDPYEIGLIMGVWGFVNIFVQMNVLGRVIRKYGASRVYKFAYSSFLICFLMYPVSAYLARQNGAIGFGVYVSVLIQLSFQFFIHMGFGTS